MRKRHLRQNLDSIALLTAPRGIERLLGLMSRWWEGRSLAQMADTFGISRQRVRAILRGVGCFEWLRASSRRRADGRRKPPQVQVERAQAVLANPQVGRLTVRQLAAVAWTAQGLSSRDTAMRMGVAPQRVRALLIAAQQRLERHSRQQRTPIDAEPSEPTDLPQLNWGGLMESLAPVPESPKET